MLKGNLFLLIAIFAAFFIVSGSAIKCHMCNNLMSKPPVFGLCSENPDYHAMNCSMQPAKFCLKADGNFTVFNASMKPVAQNYTGAFRNCAVPDVLALFFQGMKPSNGCYARSVAGILPPYTNQDGSAFPVQFNGTVCLCDSDSCNNGNGLQAHLLTIVPVILMMLHKLLS